MWNLSKYGGSVAILTYTHSSSSASFPSANIVFGVVGESGTELSLSVSVCLSVQLETTRLSLRKTHRTTRYGEINQSYRAVLIEVKIV